MCTTRRPRRRRQHPASTRRRRRNRPGPERRSSLTPRYDRPSPPRSPTFLQKHIAVHRPPYNEHREQSIPRGASTTGEETRVQDVRGGRKAMMVCCIPCSITVCLPIRQTRKSQDRRSAPYYYYTAPPWTLAPRWREQLIQMGEFAGNPGMP